MTADTRNPMMHDSQQTERNGHKSPVTDAVSNMRAQEMRFAQPGDTIANIVGDPTTSQAYVITRITVTTATAIAATATNATHKTCRW